MPLGDWSAVKLGYKTEFRLTGQGAMNLGARQASLPSPVVGYAYGRGTAMTETALLVLEASWLEPVGAISDESLEREGFPSMAHFRRYWVGRTKKRFRPLVRVQVYRVRPYTPDDREMLGAVLFDWLYGEFTGADTEPGVLSRRGQMAAGLR